MNIQKIEVEHDEPVHCPHCNQRILSMDEADAERGENMSPCPHTLFICHDCGFEYRSALYDQLKGIKGLSNDEIPSGDGWDAYTSELGLHGAIKLASYAPAPSFFGVYVGIAPTDSVAPVGIPLPPS